MPCGRRRVSGPKWRKYRGGNQGLLLWLEAVGLLSVGTYYHCVVTCAPGFQAHAVATGSGQWQAGRFLRPCGFKLTKRERQLIRSPGKRYLPGFVNAHMTSAYTPGTPPHIR